MNVTDARMKTAALLFLLPSMVLSFSLPRGPEGLALPVGPGGLDLPTLCQTNRKMMASPACREFLDGEAQSELCVELCDTGEAGSLCTCDTQPPAKDESGEQWLRMIH